MTLGSLIISAAVPWTHRPVLVSQRQEEWEVVAAAAAAACTRSDLSVRIAPNHWSGANSGPDQRRSLSALMHLNTIHSAPFMFIYLFDSMCVRVARINAFILTCLEM